MPAAMLRHTLILAVSLCGLSLRSPAQVHAGVHLGGHVSVHASLGAHAHRTGGLHRHIDDDRVHAGPRLRPHARRHAPVVHLPAPRPAYRTVTEKVWVEGYWETVQIPAQYEYRCDPFGRRYRVLVRPARCERVWHPGYYKTVTRLVPC
jgi:hypothetical protein